MIFLKQFQQREQLLPIISNSLLKLKQHHHRHWCRSDDELLDFSGAGGVLPDTATGGPPPPSVSSSRAGVPGSLAPPAAVLWLAGHGGRQTAS